MRSYIVFELKRWVAEHITQAVVNNNAAFLMRDRRIIKRRERVYTCFPQIKILRPSIGESTVVFGKTSDPPRNAR